MKTKVLVHSRPILAWHSLDRDTPSGGDVIAYSGVKPPEIGEWLRVKGGLKMCENGLHASRALQDAIGWRLQLGRGGSLCRVALDGRILSNDDGGHPKVCAKARKIIFKIDPKILKRIWIDPAQCRLYRDAYGYFNWRTLCHSLRCGHRVDLDEMVRRLKGWLSQHEYKGGKWHTKKRHKKQPSKRRSTRK